MSTYLFVTKPEYTPERVESGIDVPWWSCSSTTARGDRALVYVTGLGIHYEWNIVSDADPHDEWKYICDVEHARTFDPPISIDEIRDAVPKDDWALLTRTSEDYDRSGYRTKLRLKSGRCGRHSPARTG